MRFSTQKSLGDLLRAHFQAEKRHGLALSPDILHHDIAHDIQGDGGLAEVTGSQSHAAYPEQGRNPAELLSRAVLALLELRQEAAGPEFDGLLMSTVVALEVGAENFGVSAGIGRLCLTLRYTG